jgi:deoxyribodipyrimidine photolyase-related protein
LQHRIQTGCKQHGIQLNVYETPCFITSLKEANEYYAGKKTYFQTDFYIHQRKRLKILLEVNGYPVGGKWSFDY